ncbi:MAG TPA: RNA polymerase sigma-54 factor, partial [Allosphingosinicella sp.]|nr:RNA polymerase sigma-54 factor [Allosphingosinicella sp.]
MALGPRLDLRQSQSLVMTPQLQQAIRLLALSNLEVESFIAEEIERNPLLDSGAAEEAPAAEAAPEAPDEPPAADAFGGGEAPLDLDVNDE